MNIFEIKTDRLEEINVSINRSVATITEFIGHDDPSAKLLSMRSLAIAAELRRRKAKESRPAEFPSKLWLVHRDEEESQGALGVYTTEEHADAALAYLRADNKYCDFTKAEIEVDAPPKDVVH